MTLALELMAQLQTCNPYLCVNSKVGIPVVWRYNLAYTELACLVEDASDVCHRISKFGLGRSESRGFEQAVWSRSWWRIAGRRMALPLYCLQIQHWCPSSAVWEGWRAHMNRSYTHTRCRLLHGCWRWRTAADSRWSDHVVCGAPSVRTNVEDRSWAGYSRHLILLPDRGMFGLMKVILGN